MLFSALTKRHIFSLLILSFLFSLAAAILPAGAEIILETPFVFEGGEIMLSQNRISIADNFSGEAAIIVRGGTAVNFSNIDFDLSNLGNHFAILAEPGSKVVFEGGSIFGANENNDEGFIIINEGELKLLTGVTIRDNRNTGKGGIIKMTGGSLTLDHAVFSGNSVESNNLVYGIVGNPDPDARKGIIKSIHTDIVIRDSEIRNNFNTFFYTYGVDSLTVSGSVFDSNTRAPDNPQNPASPKQPNDGSIFLIENSTLTVEDNNQFTNNSSLHGSFVCGFTSKVKIGDNNLFSGNIGVAGSVIHGKSLSVIIGENNIFSGNQSDHSASVFMLESSESLIIGKNNIFENNHGKEEEGFTSNGSTITVIGGNTEIGDGTAFVNNRDVFGGALMVYGDLRIGKVNFRSNRAESGGAVWARGTIHIADGAQFIENLADFEGGALNAAYSDVEIGEVSFIRNSGTNDKKDYYKSFKGGAICQSGGSLHLNGTLFEDNKSARNNAMGGAVYVEPFYDYIIVEPDDPDDPNAEWKRAWVAMEPMELTADNVSFMNNTSDGWGGALQAGNTARIDNKDDMLTVRLNTADFTGNQAELGGGAIMIGPEGSVSAKNVLIGNTDPRAEDTVIVADSGSKLRIHSREGAAITGQGMKILAVDNDADFSVSDRMFSGGFHNWVIDANITASSNFRNDLLEPVSDRTFTGTLFTAAPDNGSGEGAPVTMRDNSSAAPDTGSVILNFGVLEIGTEGAGTDIRKIWNDASDADKKRPDTDRFIRALRVMDRNGDPVTGELIFSGTRDLGDGSVCSNYYAENDPFIGLRICPPGDAYHVTIDGLLPADAPYLIEEVPPENYPDPVVEGTFETGFTITNTYVPSKPEPEKPPMEFYQLLLDAGILPGTGFPTKEDIR